MKKIKLNMPVQSTQEQLNIMDKFVDQHPDLAKGFLPNQPNARDRVAKIWIELKDKLNAHGPPVRSISEWKRVWTCRKHKAKLKLAENKKSIKKTGGGSFCVKPITESEEIVIRACGLEASVSGIENVKTFGVENAENIENQENRAFSQVFQEVSSQDNTTIPVRANTSEENSMPNQNKPVNREKIPKRRTPKRLLLERQVKVQEKLLRVKEQKLNSMKKYFKSQEVFQKKLLLVLEERNELIRNESLNAEKQKKEEIQIKKEKLALKELQLEIEQTAHEIEREKLREIN